MKHIHLFQTAEENRDFRKVMFSGKHSQLLVMSIKPDDDIEWGIEKADKTIIIIAGSGQAMVGEDERPVGPGDAIFIVAGTKHDLINIGGEDLKLVMVYAPVVYPDDASHSSKEKALVDPFSDLSGVEL